MKCRECGRYMKKGCVIDSHLEDEVVLWWFCKCGNEYPEHLYFKSEIAKDTCLTVGVEL